MEGNNFVWLMKRSFAKALFGGFWTFDRNLHQDHLVYQA